MAQITVTHITDFKNGWAYKLQFPVSELGNCIALCGWTIMNDIERTDEVRAEEARLDCLEYLVIPDGRDWFQRYGTKFNIYQDVTAENSEIATSTSAPVI